MKVPRGLNGGRKPDCAADGPKENKNIALPQHVITKIQNLANLKNKSFSWMACELLTLAVEQMKDPLTLAERIPLE